MPTSGHKKPQEIKIKEIHMADVAKQEARPEEILTQQDFQDFIAIFNAGVLSQIKPLREKITNLERRLDDLNDKKVERVELTNTVKALNDKVVSNETVVQKEIEKAKTDLKGDINQTAIDLQELINYIPNITADVKKFMELFLSLYEAWRAIFKSGIKEEENIAQMKACVANLANPQKIEVKSLAKKVELTKPVPVAAK